MCQKTYLQIVLSCEMNILYYASAGKFLSNQETVSAGSGQCQAERKDTANYRISSYEPNISGVLCRNSRTQPEGRDRKNEGNSRDYFFRAVRFGWR